MPIRPTAPPASEGFNPRLLELLRDTQSLAIATILAVTLAVALAATHLGWLAALDAWCHDAYHVLAGDRYEPSHTVIVSLDDASLEAFPDTPLVFWGPLYAKAISALVDAGALVVALDVHIGVTPTQWAGSFKADEGDLPLSLLDYDQPFDLALSGGKVILPADLTRNAEGVRLRLPAGEYVAALPSVEDGVGVTTLLRDADNVVRSMVSGYVMVRSEGDPASPGIWWSLSMQAVRRAFGDAASGVAAGMPPHRAPIAFCGPPGTIPRLSFASLLRPGGLSPQAAALVRGRAVFVGVEFEGSGDRLPTPYSFGLFRSGKRDMSNVEIHANVAETLLDPARLQVAPPWLGALFWLPFLVAAWGLTVRGALWRGAMGGLLLGLAGWWVGLAFFFWGILFPVAGLLVCLAGAFLGTSGLRLTRTERARARIRNLFGRYVSEQALALILKNGEEPPLGGAARPITVLFSDIRGFTKLSERLSPEQTLALLNDYLEQACEVVQRHGGMIDKFIGDAIMVLFGMPFANGNHARQAILAALELRDCAARFCESRAAEFDAKGLAPFHVGIGLHTGHAVVGNIGTSRRMEFTAIGDTVNLAARLEKQCKLLGWCIVASRATILAAGSGIRTGDEVDDLDISGRLGTVDVVEICGLDTPQGEGL
ncbi:adenylate/guanylate cyclase domain-containing protein [Desulfovibrio sulfodismutans]|uniref:Adenylate/guanylate cyclase domain-containing protein n=1 Tax=Desulfolutivibrio sulfodismutans TaxID=63561 RepID=A0A7K3NGB4_9BACT|nr:adenylate/guanylate cyclase domain-containing protein [Desulfolutivibrio sulfodismutans]NDY55221.1 adenylate/guanylate cyclase domain-containing protein [Desulfolutivibrio sulfodismutans]QLA12958.1 CHASE2 domain-containing protein [Desulfolutivibrio sulfodismutans DSM 3696]